MKTKFFKQSSVAIGVVLALTTSMSAVAQEAVDNKTSDDNVEQIIVTGTPGGSGVSRLDASFSITTMDASEIERFAPKSTADLFKAVPGVWVESSGGVSGANIQVRGIPAPGDAPFVTVAINGSPVFAAPSLSFFESSTIFRLDETISRMEALRGGPSPVFASGQPGLTANFLLKKGSDDFENKIKYTVSDYGLNRVDGVFGGELSKDFYYMIGGYVKSASGIRDTEFTSERGKQFTINLTKEFDNGEVSVYTRITDDHGAFYTAIPVGDSQQGIPGFDPGEGTFASNDLRFATIATNYNANTGVVDYETFDLADGRGWDGVISGLNAEFDLGNGWTVRNNLGVTQGDANTVALFNGNVDTLAATVGDGAAGTVLSSGQALNENDLIASVGFWAVEKHFNSFSNDLSFSVETDNHAFTAGLYVDSHSSDDVWSLGNDFYVTATSNSQRVEVVDGSGTTVSQNGQYSGAFFALKQAASADTRALYLADTYTLNDDINIDGGIRFIDYELNMTFDFPVTVDADGNPDTTFDSTSVLDGVVDRTEKHDLNDVTYTVGINWNFAEDQGVFARLNSGILLPTFETTRNTANQATGVDPAEQEIDQFEIGYKLIADQVSFFATVFSNDFSSAQQQILGSQVTVTTTESETMGVELDGTYYHDSGMRLGFNLTWQDAEITASSNPAIVGNQPQRIPELQFRLSPSYEFDLGDGFMTIYGSARWVDDRFSDLQNQQQIDSFTKVDFGANWALNDNLSFLLSIDNLTDEVGFTEADARTAGSQSGILKGRPIFGRSAKLSVAYTF